MFGELTAVRSVRLAVVCGGWASAFFCFHGAMGFKKYRRRGPPRLNLIPSPDHNPFFKIKALRKKKPRERSEQGRFFFSKPAGAALSEKGLFRPLCDLGRGGFYMT